MTTELAVLDVFKNVLFHGSRAECHDYIRNNKGCNALCYYHDGRLGRYASWIDDMSYYSSDQLKPR